MSRLLVIALILSFVSPDASLLAQTESTASKKTTSKTPSSKTSAKKKTKTSKKTVASKKKKTRPKISQARLRRFNRAFAEGMVDEIGANLMCQCGCTMVLSSCDCGTAEQMRGEIRDLLGQGKSKTDIVNYYVSKYGEKVLAAPVAQGFNLSAYITPFAAILVGASVIGLIVRQWVIRTRAGVPQPAPVAVQNDRRRQIYHVRMGLERPESVHFRAR